MISVGVPFSQTSFRVDDDWETIATAIVEPTVDSTVSVAVSAVAASDMQIEIRARIGTEITNVQIINQGSTQNQLLGTVNAPSGVESTVVLECRRIAGTGARVLLNRVAGLIRAGTGAVTVDPGEIPATEITSQPPASLLVAPGVAQPLSIGVAGQNVRAFLRQRAAAGSAWNETTIDSTSWQINLGLGDDGRQYQFRVIGDDGVELFSTITTITISIGAPSVSIQPVDVTAQAGSSASWSAEAIGTGSFTWEAFFNGAVVASGSGTQASYTRPLVVPAEDGSQVRFDFTNPGGTIQTRSALLTVTQITAAQDLLITDIRIVGT